MYRGRDEDSKKVRGDPPFRIREAGEKICSLFSFCYYVIAVFLKLQMLVQSDAQPLGILGWAQVFL